jgi:hypothetical protein
MTEPGIVPPTSSGAVVNPPSTSSTEQPQAAQVVGLDDLKGALKSVFNEALAQIKAELPTGVSASTGGERIKYSRPSLDEVI